MTYEEALSEINDIERCYSIEENVKLMRTIVKALSVGKCKNCVEADWYPDDELIFCTMHACVMSEDGFCSCFVREVK